MHIKNQIIYLLVLLSLAFDGAASIASNIQLESGKTDKSTPAKILYGQVKDLELRPALSQYASFGFLCAREGINELPAKVTDVMPKSMAYWQGLRTDDKIFQIHTDKNFVELSIERAGKQYSILLSNEHPFTPLEISRTGLNGIEQTNYADCWFDADLAALAMTAKGQNLIANMIRQISPTSYYVTFLDQPTVSWPVNLNTIQHYQLKDTALWARLLEQASLLRYSSQHLMGGLIEQGLEALTGRKPQKVVTLVNSDTESEHLPLDKIADIIDGALVNHNAVVIGTKAARQMQIEDLIEAMKGANIPIKDNGMPADPNFDRAIVGPLFYAAMHKTPIILWTSHAYTVINFNRNTNMITLRNPFGTDESSRAEWVQVLNLPERNRLIEDLGHGYIRLKLDTLYRYLNKVVWSTI